MDEQDDYDDDNDDDDYDFVHDNKVDLYKIKNSM